MFVTIVDAIFVVLLSSSLHQRFVAFHAKNPLRRPSIFQIFNLLLAVSAFEAGRTKGLVAGQDGQILNLIVTHTAAVCAIVADERAIAKEEEIGV